MKSHLGDSNNTYKKNLCVVESCFTFSFSPIPRLAMPDIFPLYINFWKVGCLCYFLPTQIEVQSFACQMYFTFCLVLFNNTSVFLLPPNVSASALVGSLLKRPVQSALRSYAKCPIWQWCKVRSIKDNWWALHLICFFQEYSVLTWIILCAFDDCWATITQLSRVTISLFSFELLTHAVGQKTICTCTFVLCDSVVFR